MKFRLTKDLYCAHYPYLKNKDMGNWYNKMPYYISTITVRPTL